MSRFLLGEHIYSPDIDEMAVETPAELAVGMLVRAVVAPLRVTSKVMKSIFMMGDDFRASYSVSLIAFGAIGSIAGLLRASQLSEPTFLISQLICVALGVSWKMKYGSKNIKGHKVRAIHIKSDVVESIVAAGAAEMQNIAASDSEE